jgi:hypothetical protein
MYNNLLFVKSLLKSKSRIIVGTRCSVYQLWEHEYASDIDGIAWYLYDTAK